MSVRAGSWLLVLAGCATVPVKPTPPPDERAKASQVVETFLAAVAAKDFGAALAVLGPPWTGRYSAERLARDFAAEPLGSERVERLARALPKLRVDGAAAVIPLDEGSAATLALIDGTWKLITLE